MLNTEVTLPEKRTSRRLASSSRHVPEITDSFSSLEIDPCDGGFSGFS
jgi:hypothetical protein